MRKFAELFPDIENLQVPLADLTWYHLQTLMDKISDKKVFLWYVEKTLENGWSRNILVHQIESKLYERQAVSEKTSNFDNILPSQMVPGGTDNYPNTGGLLETCLMMKLL